jgi:hypothetical protein
VFPYENRYLEPFELAVRSLNPLVAVKVSSLFSDVVPSLINRAFRFEVLQSTLRWEMCMFVRILTDQT